jgi:hypothetical protein
MIFACSILGLAAHGAIKKRWLEWLLRILMGIFFAAEGMYAFSINLTEEVQTGWSRSIIYGTTGSTALSLLRVFRQLISFLLTAVEYVIGGQLFVSLLKRRKFDFASQQIFQPASIPHMVALFIFIQTLSYLLSGISPQDLGLPTVAIPIPIPFMDFLSQLLSYNGFGLVCLSFCGVGVFVTRKPKECMQRLGWVKPSAGQVGLGLLLIFVTFFYDYLWSIFAQNLHQDLGSKLSMYNSGTFQVLGGFGPSVILALVVALCAGVGEETLTRGALQPAFGILPAGLLHGALHGQFAHAPIFIIQVAGWSCIMGIVRKYTNTTTTIIGHAGYNFVTTFLFAFNP